MYGYIYKTTNLINGKVYIGQHKHSDFDKNYYGSGKILTSAIKKYGRKNFKCELVECCHTKQEMDNKEKYWIAFYSKTNNCYNITKGGEGRAAPLSQESRIKLSKSLTGRKISQETRNNMSAAHKGIPVSKESREKISKALKGRSLSKEHREKLSKSHIGNKNPHSEEWKMKVSQANKGKKRTEQTKQRMSASMSGSNHPNYGKHLSQETKNRISQANQISHKKFCKRVIQIDYNTKQIIAEFPSIKEAERKTGIKSTYISQICSGKFKQCFGYSWCYVEEKEEDNGTN